LNTTQEKKLHVYKSSAGSGKTFTLVKEFLKLCFKTESAFTFSSILAITFTNKATYEMKNRILQALEELSGMSQQEEGSVLGNILAHESKLSVEEIQRRSQQILTAILHNYADFNISTIDRFSHRLIRTFAKDLGLSMSFQVQLEETDLLQKVVAQLIDAIGEDKSLTKLLLDFALYKIEAEKSWTIEEDLLDFSKNILNEEAEVYLKALRKSSVQDFNNTRNSYIKANLQFEKQIKGTAKQAIDLIQQTGVEDQSFAGRSKISLYFRKLLSFDTKSIKPTTSLINDIAADKWHSTKCTQEQGEKIDTIKAELLNHYNEVQQQIKEELAEYLSRQEIIKNLHSLSLLNEIEKKFAELKKEEKLLNISDFNKLIAQVVLNEPMPFIYERLGERFQHLMIDEFQDTSVLQYMNLMPLIEDSLARGKENLIVGDAKQAIYRFRGGDVEQFSAMPDYVPAIAEENQLVAMRLQTLRSQYEARSLEVNYRSSKAIVDFNNAFFDFVKNEVEVSPKVKTIFEGHQQQLASEEVTGFVSISFTKEKGEAFQDEMKALVLSDVESCLRDGYELKDIAILCRTKKDAVIIAEFLSSKQIEIISSEALLLRNSEEVLFLFNLAKWMLDPALQTAQKGIVEYLFFKEKLEGGLDDNFQNYLSSTASFLKLFTELQLEFNLSELKQLSVNELFEALIRIFSLAETYDPFLQSLQDEAFDFTKSYNSSIAQFIQWWEENQHKISIETPDHLNAISILTIHKSKGLEFPVVIYPFAKQKVEHSGPMRKNYLWAPTLSDQAATIPYALVEFNSYLAESSLSNVYYLELEKKEVDLVNDTYVAFTRAGERMYIHAETSSKTSKLLSLPNILDAYINAKGIQANEENRFNFGKEELSTKKYSTVKPKIEVQYISNSWKDKLKVSLESQHQWEEVSSTQLQRNYGTFLHNVLAKIKSERDIEAAINSFVLSGELKESDMEALEQKISKLIAINEVRPFFAESIKVKNEATLLDSNGDFLRPDRVVFMKDYVAVLDYKTGEVNDSYEEQLNTYINTISTTTDLPVRGFILYTEKEKLIEVI